jgi:aconitase A
LLFDALPRRKGPVRKDYLREHVRIRGHVFKFGKNVDTDAIIPARRCNTADPRELALYAMEDADPQFVKKMRRGDLIVADTNFGCGSSREVAPLSIKAAGVSAVIAKRLPDFRTRSTSVRPSWRLTSMHPGRTRSRSSLLRA